jgi:hypothetical protein
MIDAHKRDIARIRNGLRRIEADEQRAGQAWPAGSRHEVYFIEVDFGLLQCVADHRDESMNMSARSHLRNDAPVLLMEGDLARNSVALDPAPIAHDGGSCFVA